MSLWRLRLCVLAIIAVCGSGRGFTAVRKELSTKGLTSKKLHKPSFKLGTTELTCIASWHDLFDIFQNEAIEKRLLLIPSSRRTFPLLLIHLHNYTSEASGVSTDGVTINSSSYCQLSDSEDECAVIAVYSQSIIANYPTALLVTLGAVLPYSKLKLWLQLTIAETSWSLPLPFCSGHYEHGIVEDFVYELMKSASDNNQLVENTITPFNIEGVKYHSKQNALLLSLLLVLSPLAISLLLCWLANQYPLHRQMARNPVSKSFLFSSMIQSWVCFVYLYGYQFWGLSLFKDFLHSRNTVISTAYMPFVDIGYYVFGIMGVFYLVEFPFLLWYISTKVMAMDRRGLNRRQCMLHMLKSVGCAGMVLFMQVVSWYFTYYLIILLAFPFFALTALGACLITFILLIASTALLLLPCLTQCRTCPQQSGPIVFIVLLALICGGYIIFLVISFGSKWSASFNTSRIVSGTLVSGILALLTYTLKSVFTQYVLRSNSQEGSNESDEQTPLLMECSS